MAPNARGRLPVTPRGVTRPPRTRPLQARRRYGDRTGRPRSPVASLPPLILRQFLRPCARLAIDAVNALDAAAFTARFDDMELRDHFDHVESFLMDRDTLMAFESLWSTEDRSIHRDLPRLTTEERALYDDLRDHRIGPNLRLEQECIGFGWGGVCARGSRGDLNDRRHRASRVPRSLIALHHRSPPTLPGCRTMWSTLRRPVIERGVNYANRPVVFPILRTGRPAPETTMNDGRFNGSDRCVAIGDHAIAVNATATLAVSSAGSARHE